MPTFGIGTIGTGTIGNPVPTPAQLAASEGGSTWNATPVPNPGGDSFTDNLIQQFEPWLSGDLVTYLRALAAMFAEIEQWAFATNGAGDEEWEDDGYTILVDPDRCPDKGLPWLAQFVGERLPAGITGPLAREWVKDNPNMTRGTPRSIFLAAQRRLTGDRLVTMIERSDDVVDQVSVVTYEQQTPDPEGTHRDLLDVVPADVTLEYQVLPGQVWQDVKGAYPTWQAVKDEYPTWGDVATDMAGESSFGRPVPT